MNAADPYFAGNATDSEWFAATGHCGHCGDPGDYCTCTATDPCGCRDLHVMGSARVKGALEAFQLGLDGAVSDDQGELFGGAL